MPNLYEYEMEILPPLVEAADAAAAAAESERSFGTKDVYSS